MAYKFQLGDFVASGSITAEDELTGSNLYVSGTSQMVSGLRLEGALTMDNASISDAGLVSGSGVNVGNGNFTVSEAGAVVGVAGTYSGLASLDGGINVNDTFTVSSAGAVAGATTISGSGQLAGYNVLIAEGGTLGTSADSNLLTLEANQVDVAGALSASSEVTALKLEAGQGLFSVSKLGVTAVNSLLVDTGNTIGCDGDTDLLTLAAQSVTIASDTALQFTDSGEKISRTVDGFLDLNAGNSINLSGNVAANALLGVSGSVYMASGKSLFFNGVTETCKISDGGGVMNLGAPSWFAFNNHISSSAGLQIVGTSVLQGDVQMSGALYVAGAAAAAVGDRQVSSMELIVYGEDDGFVTLDWANFLTGVAGSGITATNGKLSTDGGGTPEYIGDANVALSEGFNIMTSSVSQTRTYTLPSTADAGDIVRIKVDGSIGTGSSDAKITGSAAAGNALIDGHDNAIVLESPHAAVSFVCSNATGPIWKVF